MYQDCAWLLANSMYTHTHTHTYIHRERHRRDKGRDDCITVLVHRKQKRSSSKPGGGFVGYYQDSGERTSDGLQGVRAGDRGVVGRIFARLTNAFRGYCRSIRISRAAAFSRELRNARIRLIQYISGRIGRGRASQSSILLTESRTLSGPPVIILGDHIARILTNSDTCVQR